MEVHFRFQAEGAAEPRTIFRSVTRCALIDDPPDDPGAQEQDSQREPPHERFHEGDPVNGEPIRYEIEPEGTNDWFGALRPVNNDDDDASQSEDRHDSNMSVADDDLALYRPLGRYTGECCPCPEHRVEGPARVATLRSLSPRLALWRNADKTDVFTGTVSAGETLYVEGLGKSASPGAEAIVWEYGRDGQTHVFSDAFTVLSQRLFPDVDFDGDVDASDKAAAGTLDPSVGWLLPPASNVCRKVQLRTDVDLPGMHVLSLSRDSTARVWRTRHPAPGDVPLLVGDQSVTNGVDGVSWTIDDPDHVYVEVGGGTSILTYAFLGAGAA
ncbi:MAG: hypothetical protein ACOX9C_13285, partial [Kiritimatiellia bacterium]